MASHVGDGEEKVTDLGGDLLGTGTGIERRFDLVGFFAHFGEHHADIVPVEADLGRLLL